MAEELNKLTPDRDLQCYFQMPSAVAALSATSDTGFTVSGSWRQQLDWAVVEWNRDNGFEHPALRNLPDGDLSGVRLSYEEMRQNCMAMDCSLWPTVDWPYLRIWATGADGAELVYKVPLIAHATPAAGSYAPAQAVFELTGATTANDYVELVWEAGDGVTPSDRHATHMMYYNDTLAGVAQTLAAAISANASATGMTAAADGAQITLQYQAAAGANGNRVGVYGNVNGAQTEAWQPTWQTMSGGSSPTEWRIDLDFSALQGYVGPDFTALGPVPTGAVRKMRWTWAPNQQAGDFARTEFQAVVSGWTVTAANRLYQVAGPGSRRIEDDSAALAYSGSWGASVVGNYSGGSIRSTETLNSSVSYTYTQAASHTLYLGTRMFQNDSAAGAQIQITIDGASHSENLALAGEDVLVRIKVADLGPGQHTVSVSQTGVGVFYFDFFEVAFPSTTLPELGVTPLTTLATDWDTEHSIALAPERTAWLIEKLGFTGRANHYVGAMWFYELIRPGHNYASATVTFTGAPDFGAYTNLQVSGAPFQHLNLIADTADSVAKAFELEINAGATAVWASAQGGVLTIWARAMGTAGNGITVTADTGGSQNFTAAPPSGVSAGGLDGDLSTMPWAGGWRTDLSAAPRINRAARDWHASYFEALRGYGLTATAAFSMELQHGDPQPATGIAQRYPSGDPALLNTPALQTNFSPTSTSFWREVYLEMANLMSAAGAAPYLQFGEVQWWYSPDSSGMPFYDAYATSAFQTAYGRPMGVIASQNTPPAGFTEECAFLAELIAQFTQAIMDYVRTALPGAVFEALYPLDVNDTPLNRIVNYPLDEWTPAKLVCLKTENFTYTGDRDLDKARESIALPAQLGFPPAQASHLIGISDYTTPWQRERQLALAQGVESVALFALDQFCLIGYGLPLNRGIRRVGRMGA
jgi:hypothetical protein